MNQAGPRALLEHLDRAESLATNGDARGAVSFYQAALTEARSLQGLDSGTIDRIRLGQAYVRQRAADFGRALDACAVDGPDDSLRLRHAIDMVKGQREIFPQHRCSTSLTFRSGSSGLLATRRKRDARMAKRPAGHLRRQHRA